MKSTLLVFLLLAGTTLACKVPVFRFALERWETDDYTLLYRDKDDAPDIRKQNVVVRHDPDITTRFAAHYPESVELEAPFWTGDDPAGLLDSPLRQQLLEKVIAGASTIWILVEGSDPGVNDATEAQLKSLLASAADNLEIPEGVVRPEQLDTGEINLADIDVKNVLRSPIPLEINFQILRLKHGDKNESAFRQMLLGIHPQLATLPPEEPVLVPTFGRGRMIDGLPASLLNETNIAAVSQYLCGECSCEVKEENPGADLLLTVDWETVLENSYTIIDQQLPPLVGAGEFSSSGDFQSPREPKSQVLSGSAATSEPGAKPSPLARNLFLTALAAVGLLVLASTKFWRPKA